MFTRRLNKGDGAPQSQKPPVRTLPSSPAGAANSRRTPMQIQVAHWISEHGGAPQILEVLQILLGQPLLIRDQESQSHLIAPIDFVSGILQNLQETQTPANLELVMACLIILQTGSVKYNGGTYRWSENGASNQSPSPVIAKKIIDDVARGSASNGAAGTALIQSLKLIVNNVTSTSYADLAQIAKAFLAASKGKTTLVSLIDGVSASVNLTAEEWGILFALICYQEACEGTIADSDAMSNQIFNTFCNNKTPNQELHLFSIVSKSIEILSVNIRDSSSTLAKLFIIFGYINYLKNVSDYSAERIDTIEIWLKEIIKNYISTSDSKKSEIVSIIIDKITCLYQDLVDSVEGSVKDTPSIIDELRQTFYPEFENSRKGTVLLSPAGQAMSHLGGTFAEVSLSPTGSMQKLNELLLDDSKKFVKYIFRDQDLRLVHVQRDNDALSYNVIDTSKTWVSLIISAEGELSLGETDEMTGFGSRSGVQFSAQVRVVQGHITAITVDDAPYSCVTDLARTLPLVKQAGVDLLRCKIYASKESANSGSGLDVERFCSERFDEKLAVEIQKLITHLTSLSDAVPSIAEINKQIELIRKGIKLDLISKLEGIAGTSRFKIKAQGALNEQGDNLDALINSFESDCKRYSLSAKLNKNLVSIRIIRDDLSVLDKSDKDNILDDIKKYVQLSSLLSSDLNHSAKEILNNFISDLGDIVKQLRIFEIKENVAVKNIVNNKHIGSFLVLQFYMNNPSLRPILKAIKNIKKTLIHIKNMPLSSFDFLTNFPSFIPVLPYVKDISGLAGDRVCVIGCTGQSFEKIIPLVREIYGANKFGFIIHAGDLCYPLLSEDLLKIFSENCKDFPRGRNVYACPGNHDEGHANPGESVEKKLLKHTGAKTQFFLKSKILSERLQGGGEKFLQILLDFVRKNPNSKLKMPNKYYALREVRADGAAIIYVFLDFNTFVADAIEYRTNKTKCTVFNNQVMWLKKLVRENPKALMVGVGHQPLYDLDKRSKHSDITFYLGEEHLEPLRNLGILKLELNQPMPSIAKLNHGEMLENTLKHLGLYELFEIMFFAHSHNLSLSQKPGGPVLVISGGGSVELQKAHNFKSCHFPNHAGYRKFFAKTNGVFTVKISANKRHEIWAHSTDGGIWYFINGEMQRLQYEEKLAEEFRRIILQSCETYYLTIKKSCQSDAELDSGKLTNLQQMDLLLNYLNQYKQRTFEEMTHAKTAFQWDILDPGLIFQINNDLQKVFGLVVSYEFSDMYAGHLDQIIAVIKSKPAAELLDHLVRTTPSQVSDPDSPHLGTLKMGM